MIILFLPLQRAIRPLCNLSLDDAMELMELVERHVDWEAIGQELQEFSAINGQGRQLRWEATSSGLWWPRMTSCDLE